MSRNGPPPACPKCHSESRQTEHCGSAACNWWVCAQCKIRYDVTGRWMEGATP